MLGSSLIRAGAGLSIAAAIALSSTPARASCDDGRPINCGHRGTGTSNAQNPAPENTIPSLLKAGEEGATMVEFDIRITADGVPVLMHDATVEETTDGMGCVSELTLEQLQALDAGFGTPAEGQGITAPTLAEVLAQVDLDLNVELKYSGGGGCPELDRDAFASAVLDVLAEDEVADRWQTISSFDLGLLEAVRAQDGGVYLGFLTFLPESAPAVVAADLDALNLEDTAVSAETVAAVRAAGLEVNVWTVDDPARIAALFDLEVDAIISNEPDRVAERRAELCPEVQETDGDTGEATGDSDSGEATGDSDAGEVTGDSDAGDAKSGEADTDTAGQGEAEGCGCAHASSRAPWWLALALVGLARRRRRWR
ncbi:MAG: hypothetical protein KC636_28080 [Myxococcales bacterium]|nr:hypothetical protein [Myxococcales bacterium]